MPAARSLLHRFKEPVSGLTHLAGCGFALVGLAWLLVAGRADPIVVATSVTYGLCMVALYAASSLYHLVHGDEAMTRKLRTLDRCAIFLMIAGTCTPYFTAAFTDAGVRYAMLAAVWAMALLGVGFKLLWFGAPRWLFVTLYLGMGWMSLVRVGDVVGLPSDVTGFLLAGGVTYTLGAVVYATKWPRLYPPTFGFHELWHLFVLAGSALHYVGILKLAAR